MRAQILVEELLNLHRGQGIELYWREHLHCPTEAEYIAMVNNSMRPANLYNQTGTDGIPN